MSNVYTSAIGVPKRARNKRIYADGSAFSSTTIQNSVQEPSKVTPKDIIEFTALYTPIITDYNTLYAPTHGQYPTVRLVVILDEGSEYQSMQNPIITKVNGLIDTIYFDIGEPTNGYIILQ